MSDLPPLLAFGEARRLRDMALERVELNSQEWAAKALELIGTLRRYPGGFTGEAFRIAIENQIGPIPHPNLMGAVIMRAVKTGLIKKSGRYAPMKTPKSHARETAVYVSANEPR